MATGGGAPCYFNAMDDVLEKSYSVYLNPGIKTLVKRLETQKASRPLIAHLNHDDLAEFVAKHVFERSQFYERANQIVYGSDPVDEIVKGYEQS